MRHFPLKISVYSMLIFFQKFEIFRLKSSKLLRFLYFCWSIVYNKSAKFKLFYSIITIQKISVLSMLVFDTAPIPFPRVLLFNGNSRASWWINLFHAMSKLIVTRASSWRSHGVQLFKIYAAVQIQLFKKLIRCK